MKSQMFKKAVYFLLLLSVMLIPINPQMVRAADCDDETVLRIFPVWHKYLNKSEVAGSCVIDDFEIDQVWVIAIAIIELLLVIAALVATFYIIVAGFKFVMSGGNPTETATARKALIDALIGLAIALTATGLVAFLGRTLAR